MREFDENNKVMPYERTDYAKSNILIGAKFKSSLLENKIMAMGLSMIGSGQFYEEDGKLTVTMTAAQIRKKLHMNNGSFYRQLNAASKTMTGRTIGYADPETQSFAYVAVVTDCIYSNGLYTIMFNNSIKPYLQGLDSNFTILNLTTMLEFESVYSFRIYELLKSRAYFPKGVNGKRIFKIEFSLTELKMDLGIININSDKVRTHLNNVKYPDYEKVSELATEQQFKRWVDFKANVLDVAVREINERTNDMTLSYDYLQGGKGAKVQSITFLVDLETKLQQPQVEPLPIPEAEVVLSSDDMIDALSDIIEEPLKIRELRLIAEAAHYSLPLAEKAYKITKEKARKDGVDDLVGYMVGVLKGGVREPIRVEAEKPKTIVSASAAAYNNRYQQRDYSTEEMEEITRKLIRNGKGKTSQTEN